jgi:hypothetical protein
MVIGYLGEAECDKPARGSPAEFSLLRDLFRNLYFNYLDCWFNICVVLNIPLQAPEICSTALRTSGHGGGGRRTGNCNGLAFEACMATFPIAYSLPADQDLSASC